MLFLWKLVNFIGRLVNYSARRREPGNCLKPYKPATSPRRPGHFDEIALPNPTSAYFVDTDYDGRFPL